MEFKRLLDIMRFKHFLVFFSYAAAAFALSNRPLELWAVLAGLAGGLGLFASAYSYNYATDEKEDLKNRRPTPLEFVSRNKVVVFAAASSALALGASWAAGALCFALAIPMLIIGWSYSYPSVRLKKMTGVKTLSIVTWWFMLFLYFSIAAKGTLSLEPIVIGLFFCMTSLAGTVFRDVLDVKGDAAAGVRTIPVALGEYRTNLFMAAVVFAKYLLLLASVLGAAISPVYFVVFGTIPVKRGFLNAFVSKDHRRSANYSLGSYMITALAVIAAQAI